MKTTTETIEERMLTSENSSKSSTDEDKSSESSDDLKNSTTQLCNGRLQENQETYHQSQNLLGDGYSFKDKDIGDRIDTSKMSHCISEISYSRNKPYKSKMDEKQGKRSCCGPKVKITFGILCLIIGILTYFYTPLDFLMWERLNMRPGLPAFDWWADPPDNVFFKVYVFNVTNGEAFIDGSDNTLRYQEVGPVIYKEKLKHRNITFNENGTMTYWTERWCEDIPEYNAHIDFNATIYVVNLASVGIASYVDHNIIAKSLFRFMRNPKDSPTIVKTTIYNYLWNFSDPLLKSIKKVAPGLIPGDNLGIVHRMFADPIDQVTVFIGPKWGHTKFFMIDNFHGSDLVPGFEDKDCANSLANSTEGLIYSQYLTKESVLYFWRKSLCQVVQLYYEEEVKLRGVSGYRFVVTEDTYSHSNKTDDCYAGSPRLVDGLSDISQCYYNFPIVSSHPHFWGTDPKGYPRIAGINPSKKRHRSYCIVNPLSGIPLESAARAQVSIHTKKLSGHHKDIQRFSEMTMPMFWMEISEFALPEYVWGLVIFGIKIVPFVQAIMSTALVIYGGLVIFRMLKSCKYKSLPKHSQIKIENMANKQFFLEKESTNVR